MTTYLYIDNYRGFRKSYIPLRQVNFLVGENSTGKTSFLELLEMFCYPPFWLIEPKFGVHGANHRHFFDLVSASSKSKVKFTVGAIEIPESADQSCTGMLVTYENSEGRPVTKRVSVINDKTIRTVDGRLWITRKGEKYKERKKKCSTNINAQSPFECAKTFVSAHNANAGFSNKEVSEEMQGGPLFLRLEDFFFDKKSEDREFQAPSFFKTRLVNLAPIRSKPERTYDAPQTEFSPEGKHTPYVIRKRLSNKTQADTFSKFLAAIGRGSGLFEEISVKSYGNNSLAPFELKVALGKATLGLDNVGYGVSQALPVIVELFVRPNGSTFTVQQPEVHLHPKAQASIGELIAIFARTEKKCFVVETHSDFTIDRFRLNVRRSGAISSQLLFFERSDSSNVVHPIEINKDGGLDENQPKNYRDFFFNESLSLLG